MVCLQGGRTWKEAEEMLKEEAKDRFEGLEPGDPQAVRDKCMEILRDIAGKPWRELTSHDLRKILLLRQDVVRDGARLCDISYVRHLFSSESPQVAVSYQWMASMGGICDALGSKFEGEALIWLDILFNPQGGSSLSTEKVIEITKKTYLGCQRHVLIVHKGSDLARLMQRGWILMEIAVRTASDQSMVEILDNSGKRAEKCRPFCANLDWMECS